MLREKFKIKKFPKKKKNIFLNRLKKKVRESLPV